MHDTIDPISNFPTTIPPPIRQLLTASRAVVIIRTYNPKNIQQVYDSTTNHTNERSLFTRRLMLPHSRLILVHPSGRGHLDSAINEHDQVYRPVR